MNSRRPRVGGSQSPAQVIDTACVEARAPASLTAITASNRTVANAVAAVNGTWSHGSCDVRLQSAGAAMGCLAIPHALVSDFVPLSEQQFADERAIDPRIHLPSEDPPIRPHECDFTMWTTSSSRTQLFI